MPITHGNLLISFTDPVDKGNAPYPDFITGVVVEGDALNGGGCRAVTFNTSKELAADDAAIRRFAELVVKDQLVL
jgi:hypothetical protein